MLPNQGKTINIAAVLGRRFGIGDGSSVLSFSHKMKVFHIDLMSNLDITKANGPDDISARMLKETALSITSTPVVTHLFNISITLGELPDEWKMARVSPIPKSGNHSDPGNYRPISLLSLLSKLLEKHIHHLLATHL